MSPPIDPPAGQQWVHYTNQVIWTGEAAPGNAIFRWPNFDGRTHYTYGSTYSPPGGSGQAWYYDFESAWELIQAETYTDSVWNGDTWGLIPESASGSGLIYVGVGDATVTNNPFADNQPVYDVWYNCGFAGSEVLSVRILEIRGAVWLAEAIGSDLLDDGGGTEPIDGLCGDTTINDCGGGLEPLPVDPDDPDNPETQQPVGPELEAAQDNFRIEIMRTNRTADISLYQLGQIADLTWPRMGLSGPAYLLHTLRRQHTVQHAPPASRTETRAVFVRIPSRDVAGTSIWFIVDTDALDGVKPLG